MENIIFQEFELDEKLLDELEPEVRQNLPSLSKRLILELGEKYTVFLPNSSSIFNLSILVGASQTENWYKEVKSDFFTMADKLGINCYVLGSFYAPAQKKE